MDLVKKCPSCGLENPMTEALCSRCMADISGVSPMAPAAPDTLPETSGPDATVLERRRSLRFEASDGSGGFSVENGAVIGRDHAGGESLAGRPTVSRRHLRVIHDGAQWLVEDLGSTNGVWINERRIEPGRPCPIRPGDSVGLSRACVFRIREN